MATTLSSAPSENWDDDFEFQATNPRNSPVRNRPGNYNANITTKPIDANHKNMIHGTYHDFEPIASDRRMSTVSSHLTMEDWDAESSQRDVFSSNIGKRVLEDKKNIDTQLSDWAEPGPSTPSKRLSTQDEAENWDDDFEDKDSPKKGAGSPRKGSASTKSRALYLQKRMQQPEEPQESWDDEFGLSRRTPRNKKQHQTTSSPSSHKGSHRRPQRDYTSSDDDASDDEKEFGFADRDEEDKTVTARSRRAALSRLTGSSSSTTTAHPSPPPPVPALPSAFLTHNINANLSSSPTQPFPRSPTASVFSVPTTVADSHSITSTTRLRPSISRSSGSAALARLPPSPPIHKGRRLRKKSRPAPQGVFELSNMRYPYQPGAYQYSFSDGEVDGKGRASVDEPRSSGGSRPSSTVSIGQDAPLGIVIPPTTPSRGSNSKNPAMAASESATPATPVRSSKKATSPKNATPSSSSKGSATLLSRIGSVKRWGAARRARGSSMTPSEVAAAGTIAERPSDSEHQLTPRPQSSLSSLHPSSSHQSSPLNPTPPHANSNSASNWFFRGSSGGGGSVGGTSHRPYNGGSPHRPMGGHSRAGSMTDLDLREKMYTPSPDRSAPGQIIALIQDSNLANINVTSTTTPSKLIKRKSLGFVQLRRGFGGHGGGTVDLPSSNGTADGHESHIQPRHASYGGLGLGRAGEDAKERDEGMERDRKRSISRSGKDLFSFGDGDKGNGVASEKGRDVKEGNRGFMGNVRKISLVGRHKRAKSGVSPVGGTENGHAPGEGSGEGQRPPKSERRRPSGDKRGPSMADALRSDANAVRGPSVDELRRPSTSGSRPSTSDGRRRSVDGKRRPSTGDGRRPSVGDGRRPSVSETRRPSTESRKPVDIPKTPPPLPQPLLPPIELQPPSPPRLKGKPSVSWQGTVDETTTGSETMLSPSTSSLSLGSTPKRTPSIKFATSAATKPTFTTLGTSSSSIIPTSPPRSSSSPAKTPSSPQSASLGRSAGPATANAAGSGSTFVPRRNSLGDLKIPARITQAQVGLRRDLEMVREFATNIEQLKEMQTTYHTLVSDVQRVLDSHAQLHVQQQQPQIRATSPSFFKPLSRRRASTNPDNMAPSPSQIAYKDLASAFYTINSRYRISWECAELLIELGGTGGSNEAGPPTSTSAPAVFRSAAIAMSEMHVKKGRDRAITLASDSKPPTPTPGSSSHTVMNNASPLANSSLAWRTSTGKNDLSHRQLNLLREMLSRGEPLVNEEDSPIPEEAPTTLHVNRDWRWGDPMSSTVTLPSEEGVSGAIQSKKRRSSRLGLTGLRDMLRSLKRSTTEQPSPPIPPIPASSTSLSTDSSFDNRSRHRYSHALVPNSSRRRAKTSVGPEDVPSMKQSERPVSPYAPSSFSARASPRRPSLASIFRLGLKHKTTPPRPGDTSMDSSDSNYNDAGRNSNSTGEEDWDQMDTASDLDAAGRALELGHDGSATVRGSKGRSPYLHRDPYAPPLPRSITPKRSASGSQTSLYGESSGVRPRSTRLSNVEEHGDQHRPTRTSSKRHSKTGASPSRPTSRLSKRHQNGSVRSMPPQPVSAELLDPKLALTPDNIKPLLENAKEIHVRLGECISEIRALLPAQP